MPTLRSVATNCPATRAVGWLRRMWPVSYLAVGGESMTPTLANGDWILAWRAARARIGDIVVAAHPAGEAPMLLVKRVSHIGPGGFWLLGDNHLASTDSRVFGPVPEIAARVFWRVRPWGPIPPAPGAVPDPMGAPNG